MVWYVCAGWVNANDQKARETLSGSQWCNFYLPNVILTLSHLIAQVGYCG